MDNFSGTAAVFASVAPELMGDILKFVGTLPEEQVAEFLRLISLSVEAGQAWEADVYASQTEDY